MMPESRSSESPAAANSFNCSYPSKNPSCLAMADPSYTQAKTGQHRRIVSSFLRGPIGSVTRQGERKKFRAIAVCSATAPVCSLELEAERPRSGLGLSEIQDPTAPICGLGGIRLTMFISTILITSNGKGLLKKTIVGTCGIR